jgi:uncharacterized protein (TIGR00251 family)
VKSKFLAKVRVRPGAKRERVTAVDDAGAGFSLSVELKAPAQDGKANAALIKLLSRHFSVPQAAIRIKRGAASRHKIVEVVG